MFRSSVIVVVPESPAACGRATLFACGGVISGAKHTCNALAVRGPFAGRRAIDENVIAVPASVAPYDRGTAAFAQDIKPFRVENDTCIWKDL